MTIAIHELILETINSQAVILYFHYVYLDTCKESMSSKDTLTIAALIMSTISIISSVLSGWIILGDFKQSCYPSKVWFGHTFSVYIAMK